MLRRSNMRAVSGFSYYKYAYSCEKVASAGQGLLYYGTGHAALNFSHRLRGPLILTLGKTRLLTSVDFIVCA